MREYGEMTRSDKASIRNLAIQISLRQWPNCQAAINGLHFVQADPIRAPARAQDLILWQRVRGYRAGDLERKYARLDVHEDFVCNYGFVSSHLRSLIHPRNLPKVLARMQEDHGEVLARLRAELSRHPRGLHPNHFAAHVSNEKTENYWGGKSNLCTHMLDALHYAGEAQVVRREKGIRVYALAQFAPNVAPPEVRAVELMRALFLSYAPLSSRGMLWLASYCYRSCASLRPYFHNALDRIKKEWAFLDGEGVRYYYPPDVTICSSVPTVRIVAPFDPVVWDRTRFEHLHGWEYRFEAYTPPAKRKMGYYAMPILHRGKAIGWCNVTRSGTSLDFDCGYVNQPQSQAYRRALESEFVRIARFLGVT